MVCVLSWPFLEYGGILGGIAMFFYICFAPQNSYLSKKARSYLRSIATIKRNRYIIIYALLHHAA